MEAMLQAQLQLVVGNSSDGLDVASDSRKARYHRAVDLSTATISYNGCSKEHRGSL